MASSHAIILPEQIESRILFLRRHKVLLDADLAALYDIPTKALLQAVKRNSTRFPEDFMFQLTAKELDDIKIHLGVLNLRSQIVTSSLAKLHGGRRYRPYAFTEQGTAMLSSVLRSPRAIQVNIEIMRVFVRLRRALFSHTGLARRLGRLEQKCDARFRIVFDALRRHAASPPDSPRERIGFHRQ